MIFPLSPVRTQALLTACACGGATAFLFAVDPNRTSVYPTCFLYQRTGIYCAGCGATRATFALLHGRVLEALHDNLLFILALPFLVWKLTGYLARTWREESWPEVGFQPRLAWRWGLLSLGLLVGFMVLRNLPYAPFTLLAPLAPAVHFEGIRP